MNKKSTHDVKKGHRIGLYIRVSTEEQASNPEGSIKSQEQRLRSLIEIKNHDSYFGEVVHVFIDRARSGKDTNRPELQRLLTAVKKKEVTLVMVTELSRLSRSIKDFCDIWELMRNHSCVFQSLREQFDTTTAAGEMVLYTIANIAQFERKQTSERISANFKARAERGLANGGCVAFGYELDTEKKGYLKVNKKDAATVGEAFNTFLKEGCLSKAGKALNDRGYRLSRHRQGGGNRVRLDHFTIDNLHNILTNRAYIGVRVFKVNGEIRTSKAVWEPIVDEVLFKNVQTLLKKNFKERVKSSSEKRFPYQLSGVAFCGHCNDRMTGKSAHGNGKKIAYYEHSWATKRQSCLNKKIFDHEPRRILAKKLEPLVWNEITNLLTHPEIAKSLVEEAHRIYETQGQVRETELLRSKVLGIHEQIEALAEHLSKIPKGVSPAPVFAQMERLEKLKSSAGEELERLVREGGVNDLPIPLKDYQSYLSTIRQFLGFADSPELKAKIIKRLVHKIETLKDGFRIHYFVGQSVLVPTDWDHAPKDKTNNFLVTGSNSLTNGGCHRARTCDLRRVKATL